MNQEIKILMLEDFAEDSELELYELQQTGLDFSAIRVQSETEYRQALEEFKPDLVLSDFSIPGFGGMAALAIIREIDPDLPFVFVSGTIGEERAIESFKRGATDYVLKSNLSRLGPVVKRALKEAKERAVLRKAENDLLASEEKFRAIVETTQEWFWETNESGYCTFNSPFIYNILGYSPAEITGQDRLNHMHLQDQKKMKALGVLLEEKKQGWTGLISRWRHKDGSYRSLESNALPLFDEAGKVIGYRGTDRDVTERIRQQQNIARLSRINAVSSNINAMIVRAKDHKELFREVCRIAVEHGEFKKASIGLKTNDGTVVETACAEWNKGIVKETSHCHDFSESENREAIARVLKDRVPIVINDSAQQNKTNNDDAVLTDDYRSRVILPLSIEDNIVAVMMLNATREGFFVDSEMMLLNNIAADLSFALNHLHKKEKLNYLSYYDALTGLPNRTLFCDRVNQLIHSVEADKEKLAVIVIDLDRFRSINETLGRQAGDELLSIIASRFKTILPEEASPGRLSGNCFAAAIPFTKNESEVVNFIEQKIFSTFLEPIILGGIELRVSAKCGIALYPVDSKDGDILLVNAEAALKKAKKEASDKYAFYTLQLHTRVAERLTLENQLRLALEREQFVLYYQPKMDMKSKRISGLEALVRWESPERGLVPPDKFIPLLEETGLIKEVGKWIIEKAGEESAHLLNQGFTPRIAVNVSALQLQQKEFVDQVATVLEKNKNICDLDIEVTESLLMGDLDGSIEKLNKVRKMGLAIALDDFGTGFSSLSYLIKLPIDWLKIDKAFIANMTSSPENLSIVTAVIQLAHSLGLKVIAEGVETKEQVNLLGLLNCDEMQGYYFSHPVSITKIETMLRNAASNTMFH